MKMIFSLGRFLHIDFSSRASPGGLLLLAAIACLTAADLSPAFAAAPTAATAPASGEPDLAEVRAATERFRDVNVALAEGYVRDPMNLCDTAPMMGRPAALGAMGIHFFRPDLLGITGPPNPRVDGDGTHTDFRRPRS